MICTYCNKEFDFYDVNDNGEVIKINQAEGTCPICILVTSKYLKELNEKNPFNNQWTAIHFQ